MKRVLIFFLAWLVSFSFAIFIGMKIKERHLGLFQIEDNQKYITSEIQNLGEQIEFINLRIETLNKNFEEIQKEIKYSIFWNTLIVRPNEEAPKKDD